MFNSNSNRVFASSRKAPCIRLVTIETPGLLDPVGRHALMFGFDDNCSPTRLYRSFERIRDLRAPAFLNLQSTRTGFDDACNHADPYYTPVRQVKNVCLTDNRHDMMLAVRHELDISQEHHFVISVRFFEGAHQIRRRIDMIASEELFVCICHTTRRIDPVLTGGVVARPQEKLPGSFFIGFTAYRSRLGLHDKSVSNSVAIHIVIV